MKFWAALSQLPHSLLVASLALTVIAAPVESVEVELTTLGPDNFDQTIAKGVWFIEHFSPYCRHCREFKPTWERLVAENQQNADPGIRLAQVNCAVHGDFCNDHKVTGYPQMNLYRNGVFQEMFTDSRDYERLTSFLSKNAEPTSVPEPVPMPEPTPSPENEPAPIVVQDSYPAAHGESFQSQPTRDLNPSGTVLVLTDKTFQDAVDQGNIFIKFFAPWCGHCKKLAPIWTELAAQMQHKLAIAEVNCDDYNSLCRAEGVAGFPMLIYYAGKKGGKTEYTSGRKLEQLKAFSEKISGPPMREMMFEELESKVQEHPVLYLLLHPPSANWPVNYVLDASHVLFGSPPIYSSTSNSLYAHFGVSSDESILLALKDGDASAPMASYHFTSQAKANREKAAFTSWLLRNRLPLSVELGMDTFQDIMNAPQKPLVVIAAADSVQLHADIEPAVRKLARQWRDARADSSVVFAWMDAERWETWLKSMYGIKANNLPAVVVANHSQLLYWDKDQFGEKIQLTPTSLFSAINGARNGTIKSKHSENIVERMARFLNGGLMGIEGYVSANPWKFGFAALFFFVGVIWAISRVASDTPAYYEFPRDKGDRLD